MKPVIEVIIAPDGASTVRTTGFSGSACREASQFIEAALGERTAEQLTSEYFSQQHTAQQLRERS